MSNLHISVAKVNDFQAWNKEQFDDFHIYDLRDLSEVVALNAWSPCVWKNGDRAQKNFIFSQLVTLDIDDGKPTLSDMINTLKKHGYAHIIGTTKSHQKPKKKKSGKIDPPCDRYRVIIPSDRPFEININQYQWQMGKVYQTFEGCDENCKDAARFYFPCRLVDVIEGKKFILPNPPSIEWFQKKKERSQKRAAAYKKNLVFPAWLRQRIDEPVTHERHNAIHYTAKGMAKAGYSNAEIENIVYSLKMDQSGISDKEYRRQMENGIKRARECREIKKSQQEG